MSYSEQQRERAVSSRNEIFNDSGQGVYKGIERTFVLSEPKKNLWKEIREEAIAYFSENKIKWWDGHRGSPTGHLLSSQVSCVNHLFPMRKTKAFADGILHQIDSTLVSAELVDSGYVEFEFIGEKQYLKERAFKRGANCTSIDAVMIGLRNDGSRVMVLIEWKYTEGYGKEDKYIIRRANAYDHLIVAEDSPFKNLDPRSLYYEPFYQLMRQTLLANEIVKYADHKCSDYVHVVVCPKGNAEFLNTITSQKISGASVEEAWKSILKRPEKFKVFSPEEVLASIPDSEPFKSYLKHRYW